MAAGLVFAAIVVLWAAYFVPLALRRYDEAARSGAVAHVSPRARVLHGGAVEEEPVEEPVEQDAPVRRGVPDRATARLAVRRRRRTLIVLLLALTAVAGVSIAGLVAPWWPAVPATLVVAWLVACRVQVIGEQEPDEFAMAHERHLDEDATRRESDALHRADTEDTVVLSGQAVDHDPHRVHVMEEVPLDPTDVEEVVVDAVPVTATTGMTLWDPLPVTLPTYVDKPRAARTVRTIDFAAPGAWTSGRGAGEVREDADPAAEARSGEGRRAVND